MCKLTVSYQKLRIFGFYDVISRKVIKDGGDWQLVELQEAASWRL